MTEQLQWQLFIKGGEEALGYFFRKYHADLFRYGVKLCGNKEVVNDSIQELFLKLWKNRESISVVKVAKPYLLKALRRHIQTNLELHLKYCALDDSAQFFHIEFSAEDFIIEGEDEKEKCQTVLKVLNQLSPRQREAIFLRFFEDLDFDTISKVMDMNVQSVRNAIHRGLQTMREYMVLESFLIFVGSRIVVS
jgi:RNA polymerase sigma factor (sigma-70 family)